MPQLRIPKPVLLVANTIIDGVNPSFEACPQVLLAGDVPVGFDISLLDRVFSKKLRTVKSIPPKLRPSFAKVFLIALDLVLARPGDLSSWVQLLVLPCCILCSFLPKNKSEGRSGVRQRCQFDSISRALLRWRDPSDRLRLVLDRLSDVAPSSSEVNKPKSLDEHNLFQCKRKLGDGHFIAVIKVLTSSGIAPLCHDTSGSGN